MRYALIVAACVVCHAMAAQPVENDSRKDRSRAQSVPVDERAQKEADRVAKDLGLTDSQKQQWAQAARERAAANEPLRKRMKETSGEEQKQSIRREIHANNRAFHDKVRGMLTDDQRRKMRQMHKDRGKKRRQNLGDDPE